MLKPSYTIEWEANFKASVRCCNTLTIWLTSCSTVLSTLCNTESICSRVFDRLLMSCCKIAMSAEFPATKQFIVDVAIAQMSKPIFSRPLLILAINFNTTADVCSTLHTLSNTFIIFFETELIMDSMVDFIVLVISLVTSSAAVFDNAETTAPIATEHITAAPIITVAMTIEAAALA